MLSKILIIGALGTTLIGGGAATGSVPNRVELAIGTVRLASGDGAVLKAKFEPPAPLSLTIHYDRDNKLIIKF